MRPMIGGQAEVRNQKLGHVLGLDLALGRISSEWELSLVGFDLTRQSLFSSVWIICGGGLTGPLAYSRCL